MLKIKSLLYYEGRVAFGFASLLPALLLPLYMIISWIAWEIRSGIPNLSDLRGTFQLLLTLSAGLTASHLMTIEREEGFDTLRRTYPERSFYLPVMRTIGAFVLILASGAVSALILYLRYGAYDVNDLLLMALIPAFYLCSVALLLNQITGSYWVASGLIVAYWFGELTTVGKHTGIFYLFNHAYPNGAVDLPVNVIALISSTLVFIVLNIAFNAWRRRRA